MRHITKEGELYWRGMPAFQQESQPAFAEVKVCFNSQEALEDFGRRVYQRVTPKTKSIWHPFKTRTGDGPTTRVWEGEEVVPSGTRYPIYIISKGRAARCLTAVPLEKMGLNFYVCVEPQEVTEYAKYIDPKRILTLPFSNLGQGSIPARNWVWEHSLSNGSHRHWILDDNIQSFHRLHCNRRYVVHTGAIFRAAEDFTDRFSNVGLSGLNYYSFAVQTERRPPYYLNTRIYSCLLVDNSLPFRWRGKYNEDTDLSLRVLKSGLCTVLFNAFLCGKRTTLTMKGGNTDNVYNDGTNRLAYARELRDAHPECVKIVRRYNRYHQEVDYSAFKETQLVLKTGSTFPEGEDEYGMRLTPDKTRIV